MPDQSTHTLVQDDAVTEGEIMAMLLAPDAQRPWTPAEIAREIGDDVAATDGLARLYGAGLVHRLDGFVFATRAALRSDQLAR
jgi:hypothetical protein